MKLFIPRAHEQFERPSAPTSASKRGSNACLTACAFVAAILLCAFSSGKLGLGQEDAEPVEEPVVVASTDDASTAVVPVNWLPDLRVSEGAPETRVDLSVVSREFCEKEYFGDAPIDPENVVWSIEQITKPNVAEVELTDQTLTIGWKDGAVDKTKIVLKASPKDDDSRHAYAVFYAESWAPDYTAITLIFIGGLGLFLLGMRNMSDGLTAIAGSRLRRLISMFTNNRMLAIGVGILTTTLVQSSTATSVMTLGFVNSGLMTLKQAIGVIIGANVGTTTTGWLLTVDIGKYGLPILGVAALFLLFSKRDQVRNFATFAMGIGMIFFSLETLKNGMAPLADLPQVTAALQAVQANSMVNVGWCILAGCVTTFLVHSSAVTLALTMTLAILGSIDLNSAVAIVLGSNIGTTLTALFVSVGTNPNARRVAYFHLIFNLFGVLWVWAFFFSFLIPCVETIGNAIGAESDITKIALTHTIFNLANMIVFIPLVGPVDKLLHKLVKETEPKVRPTTTSLSTFTNEEPVIAIERSRLEVQSMFLDCRTLADNLATLQADAYEDSELVEASFKLEDKLDDVQDETIDFVSKTTTKTFSADVAASAREQVRLAEELETISDYLAGVLKSNLKLKNAGLTLPKEALDKTPEFIGNVKKLLEWLESNFSQRKHSHLAGPMGAWRRQYVEDVKETRDRFMQTMFEEKSDPRVIVAVDYQLNAWRRMYEHLLNIAEAMELPGSAANHKATKK